MGFLGLEIGAGANPQKEKNEGWLHQDIRDLPGIDWVGDFRELPWGAEHFDAVFSSHGIEHTSWRETQAVLEEWLRVLKTGGTLELITPDFFRLWENLITGRVLPESGKWAGGPVTPAFVAYVTGGGQDHEHNYHTAHYTDAWYFEALTELGCDVTIKYHGIRHPSPSIRVIAVKGTTHES
jgi:ubiquinone/menaquinone biosynthesis C-methylase UbiE